MFAYMKKMKTLLPENATLPGRATAMPVPDKYRFAPNGTPAGQPYNVAQAYARAADALRGGGSFDVDFDLAVRRHKLIDAIERSSATGRSVRLD